MIAAPSRGRTSGRDMIAATRMAIELTEKDFVPLEQCQFQHWGDRTGAPFDQIRPLGDAAAERVWARAAALSSATWSEAAPGGDQIDLGSVDGDEKTVKRHVAAWLRRREASDGPGPDQPVILCYQPRVAVVVPWAIVCEHWLIFFWTPACAWPTSEQWVLVHDGDRFAFGRRP